MASGHSDVVTDVFSVQSPDIFSSVFRRGGVDYSCLSVGVVVIPGVVPFFVDMVKEEFVAFSPAERDRVCGHENCVFGQFVSTFIS